MAIRLKNIRADPSPDDGLRVLADRLWPRGISKERAALDLWAQDATPSDGLRRAVHAGDIDWATFVGLYREELTGTNLEGLRHAARSGNLTLLTAVKEPESSHLSVLRDALEQE